MKKLILIAFVLLVKQSAIAQLHDAHEPYWKVYTDAIAKATVVNFFDTDRHLIYQEVLDDKYLKLTKKNRRTLDNILRQITKRNFVATTAKLDELKEPVKRRSFDYTIKNHIDDKWHCNSTILQQSTLQVNIQNPKGKKLSVKLFNPRGEAIFMYTLAHTDYKLYNLEMLRAGTYQLVVSDGQNCYTQDVLISDAPLQRMLVNKPSYNGTF